MAANISARFFDSQLLSSFTSGFESHGRDPLFAMPKCVATRANSAPILPTPPRSADFSLPLQVWAGPLSGGRLAVVLVNAGSIEAPVEATWALLGIKNELAAYSVRDATAQTANGTATASVRARVASHDAVVLVLAPL